RVATERQHAAAGPPDVPEQQLDDRGGADVLDADRVLRPADGVGEGARALAPGVLAERLGDGEELLDAAATCVRDELGRVAGVVALEDLEDAAGMRQRRILGRRLALLQLPVRAVRS